jgi:hypothetical protein
VVLQEEVLSLLALLFAAFPHLIWSAEAKGVAIPLRPHRARRGCYWITTKVSTDSFREEYRDPVCHRLRGKEGLAGSALEEGEEETLLPRFLMNSALTLSTGDCILRQGNS